MKQYLIKEDFIKEYCEKSNITKEKLLEHSIILPCDCNYEGCHGWAVVSNNELSVRAHLENYTDQDKK